MKPSIPFEPWPKIHRLERDIVITEKIDGTNAGVFISEEMEVYASSRKRWIEPGDDAFGFAAWVQENAETLVADLGAGMHFGEWWGSGIQRKYGLTNGDKRFSLFNTRQWSAKNGHFATPSVASTPVLYEGPLSFIEIHKAREGLSDDGSRAAPGFMRPEGIVIFHIASQTPFKWTFDGDGHKG